MTRDEAIETLEEMIKLGDLYEVDIDACEIAIEALKQEPSTVLQEIRQEILEQGKDDVCAEKHGCIDEILEIIDKHIGDMK